MRSFPEIFLQLLNLLFWHYSNCLPICMCPFPIILLKMCIKNDHTVLLFGGLSWYSTQNVFSSMKMSSSKEKLAVSCWYWVISLARITACTYIKMKCVRGSHWLFHLQTCSYLIDFLLEQLKLTTEKNYYHAFISFTRKTICIFLNASHLLFPLVLTIVF